MVVSMLVPSGFFFTLSVSSLPLQPPVVFPLGTRLTVGSFPLCSAFKLGRFAGALLAVGTLPRL